MRKHLIYSLSFLLCGLVFANNLYADPFIFRDQTYRNGSTLSSYVYNRAIGTVLKGTTVHNEVFQGFSGMWAFEQNIAKYGQNLHMKTPVEDISATWAKASVGNEIAIEILRDNKLIGTCAVVYGYSGVSAPEYAGMVGPKYRNVVLPYIKLIYKKCSKGYDVETRGWYGFPNSLILHAN